MACFGWFVLMPEHVHRLACPLVPKPEIDKSLFAIKRPFPYRMKKHFQRTISSQAKSDSNVVDCLIC